VLQVLDAERLYQQARLGFVRAEVQRLLRHDAVVFWRWAVAHCPTTKKS